MENTSGNIEFLTISEFKSLANEPSMKLKKNPKNGKFFVVGASGKTYKAQGDLDINAEIAFLVEDGDYMEACMINIKDSNTVAEF